MRVVVIIVLDRHTCNKLFHFKKLYFNNFSFQWIRNNAEKRYTKSKKCQSCLRYVQSIRKVHHKIFSMQSLERTFLQEYRKMTFIGGSHQFIPVYAGTRQFIDVSCLKSVCARKSNKNTVNFKAYKIAGLYRRPGKVRKTCRNQNYIYNKISFCFLVVVVIVIEKNVTTTDRRVMDDKQYSVKTHTFN